jgi:hypothetical protein
MFGDMAKASFVVGVAVGYVLGARAGRKRYEQIKGQAAKLWNSDPVQHRVEDATQAVKDQAAPYVTEKLGDAMKAVSQSMRSASTSAKVPGRTEKLPETIHRGPDGKLHADLSTGMGPGGDKLP